jgi:Leucine-rich repeat (LRR) protein
MPCLESLHLDHNSVTDVGLIELIGKGALPKLKKLHLSDNKIGDAGAKALANAIGEGVLPPCLEECYLGDNLIGDAGLIALSAQMRMGKLTNLRVLAQHSNSCTLFA